MNKLLIIADEVYTRSLLSSCLRSEGYAVTLVEEGPLGVQEVEMQVPDLVICDIAMPSPDESDIQPPFRRHPVMVEIPFIVLTTHAIQGFDLEDTALNRYLIKPTTVDALLDAIATQLGKQDLKQQVAEPRLVGSKVGATSDVGATLNVGATSDVGDPKCQSIFPAIDQLSEVFEYIEANYCNPINLSQVAQAVGYSPAYLTNLVGSRSGLTVSRWITERRMVEVRALLQSSDYSIEKIATEVGYTNVRHLFRQFRQYHNMTPQTWRQKYLQNSSRFAS
jgi:YesN/AraC family two-component response regulator